jgi:hypothetical protein
MEKSPIERAFEILKGPSGVSRGLASKEIVVTPWACNKWLRKGRLPRTEYTGETEYAKALEQLTEGQVTAEQLLEAGRARAA